jgi:hypothetical protein
MVSQP